MGESIPTTTPVWHRENIETFIWHREAVLSALANHIREIGDARFDVVTRMAAMRVATYTKGLLATEQELFHALRNNEDATFSEWHLREVCTVLEHQVFYLERLQAWAESDTPETTFDRAAECEATRRTLLNEKIIHARFRWAFEPSARHDGTEEIAAVPLRKPLVTPISPTPSEKTVVETLAESGAKSPNAGASQAGMLAQTIVLMSAEKDAATKCPRNDDGQDEVSSKPCRLTSLQGCQQQEHRGGGQP